MESLENKKLPKIEKTTDTADVDSASWHEPSDESGGEWYEDTQDEAGGEWYEPKTIADVGHSAIVGFNDFREYNTDLYPRELYGVEGEGRGFSG